MLAQYTAQSVHGLLLLGLFCNDMELYTCWKKLFCKVYFHFFPAANSGKVNVQRKRGTDEEEKDSPNDVQLESSSAVFGHSG